jgi:SAM-dependent methyltransferase
MTGRGTSARRDEFSSLRAIVTRHAMRGDASVPRKIPWNDPDFSRRMLAEHLDQRHGMASRQFATIDAHVDWIFSQLLGGVPGFVLDLGCGPGLYTQRLARLGCVCLGIDFSPASVAYAIAAADEAGLACTYRRGNMLDADLGTGHDLAMLIFGEFSTFDRDEAAGLLRRVWRALTPGGLLLLEAHTEDAMIAEGNQPATWSSFESGLFAEEAHLVLTEHEWDETDRVARTRHFVIDADTAGVTVFGERLSAHTDADYRAMLVAAGFIDIEFHGGFGPVRAPEMVVITARRPT